MRLSSDEYVFASWSKLTVRFMQRYITADDVGSRGSTPTGLLLEIDECHLRSSSKLSKSELLFLTSVDLRGIDINRIGIIDINPDYSRIELHTLPTSMHAIQQQLIAPGIEGLSSNFFHSFSTGYITKTPVAGMVRKSIERLTLWCGIH